MKGSVDVVEAGVLRGRLARVRGTIGHVGRGKGTALGPSLLDVQTTRESLVLPNEDEIGKMTVGIASVDIVNAPILLRLVLRDRPRVPKSGLNTVMKIRTRRIQTVVAAVGHILPLVRPRKSL